MDSPRPFVAFHRARRTVVAGKVVAITLPLIAVVVELCALGVAGTADAAPPDKLASITSSLPGVHPTAPPSSTPVATPTPTPVATPAPSSASVPAVPAKPAITLITITATGYQAQLDECQWVRMDLDAVGPIVGAHTQCGGAVVLTLRAGQLVQLRGQGLDGLYVVTDSRDAHAGDDAQTATAGMQATVVLQTCFPGGDGRELLVGLEPHD